MKKLLSIGLVALGVMPLLAQDYPGAFNITVNEDCISNAPIVIHAQYLPGEPAVDVDTYQWELQPVDEDGEVGPPIYSETFSGDPTGDFTIPESVQASMTTETYYRVSLTGTGFDGVILAASAASVFYSSLAIATDDEICCGTPISAWLNLAFDVPLGMTYRYTLQSCDVNGNPTFPFLFHDSGNQAGWPPGVYTFPGSDQVACDTYWRIDLTLNGSPNDGRFRRTRIVYVTSFLMKTKATHCCNQSLVASAENCPGSQYTVTHHLWQAAPCMPDGSNPGTPVYVGTGWGASGVNEVLPATALSCGQYYRLICTFFNGNQTLSQRYKVIYITVAPATPVVTGPGTICGTGTFCVSNGPYSSYQWNTTFGSTVLATGPNNSSCFTIPPVSHFTSVNVIGKDALGCPSAQTSFPVTNNYLDPSMDVGYLWGSWGRPNHFDIGFVSTGTPGSASDVYKVEEVSSMPPYTPVPGTALTNLCWSTAATFAAPVMLFYYDGDANSSYNNSTINTCNNYPFPLEYFRRDRTYKLTRTITTNGCVATAEVVFYQYGALSSTTYREGNPAMDTTAVPVSSFSAFPNPSNGSFQVQLATDAENAQGELFNATGEKVDAFTFSGSIYSYSPAVALAPGMYLLRITHSGTTSTQRIVIE